MPARARPRSDLYSSPGPCWIRSLEQSDRAIHHPSAQISLDSLASKEGWVAEEAASGSCPEGVCHTDECAGQSGVGEWGLFISPQASPVTVGTQQSRDRQGISAQEAGPDCRCCPYLLQVRKQQPLIPPYLVPRLSILFVRHCHPSTQHRAWHIAGR